MKSIQTDRFFEYSFLSDLNITPSKQTVIFTETKADVQNNDYKQRLMKFDLSERTCVQLLPWTKRTGCMLVQDERVLIEKEDEEDKTVHTHFVWIDLKNGSESEGFALPLAVSAIREFNGQYLISAQTDRCFANYHEMSDKQRADAEQIKKANEDYVVFDEYPFFFNGAGITNKTRNSLYLADGKSGAVKRIVSDTMDVESFDVIGDKIIYSGVDYTDFKGKWSFVYEYDASSGKTRTLFDQKMQIYRVFASGDEIIVIGTFAKEYGAMEAGKFYRLQAEGELELVLDQEYSLYNSVGSDCRYGKLKNFFREKNAAYFITAEGSRSVLLRYADHRLEHVIDREGSVDDAVLTKDGVIFIGMLDQRLQELYAFDGQDVVRLSDFNEEVLKDCYVAKPQKLTVNKPTPIDGWVLLPKDYDPRKTYPGILDIHGGPKTAYGEVFYHEMQVWANKGYFVFFCNPRGSDGRGNAFADLRKSFGKIDYEDIMDFVDEVLRLYPSCDKNRLGVTGGSYGGYMTNWVIGHTDRFKAAASQRSISNWITEVCASDYGIDFPIEQEFDDLFDCHEELWEMSPLKYANQVVTPTLFIHSTEDYRCPIPEAIQLYTVLKCRGVESRLVAFKGENHELSRSGKPLHRLKRLSEITNWMESHLKGEEE